MKPGTLFSVLAAGFVLALIQTLGTLLGTATAITAGVVVGLLVLPLFRLFGTIWDSWWVPISTAVIASCVGTLIGSLGSAEPFSWIWLSPACALCVCGGIESVIRVRARRCQLCRGGLRDEIAFECPRCGLVVCERKCWRSDSCRCRLCADNAVPVFPHETTWWDERFGTRVSAAKCHLCLANDAASDLRACANCSWPQCRECWDYANGQCGHCGWVLADLPPTLKRYMEARR